MNWINRYRRYFYCFDNLFAAALYWIMDACMFAYSFMMKNALLLAVFVKKYAFHPGGVDRNESTERRVRQRIEWVSDLKFYGHKIPLGKACWKRFEIHPFYFFGTYTCLSLVERDSNGIVKYQWCLWKDCCKLWFLICMNQAYMQSFQIHLYNGL